MKETEETVKEMPVSLNAMASFYVFTATAEGYGGNHQTARPYAAEFDARWKEGHAFSMEQAIQFALEENK